ncbi:Heterokaryon incompatibility [Fusarium oxysporum f. sp. vasinfectum]|nr:Heterokaryon incompatibility [Fusarium oxysporum f. sp. vasinfectum]
MSPQTFSLASKWINECLQNHSKCNHGTNESWYPTRLLDSGPIDSFRENTITLLETSAGASYGPYMTLSHCWGSGHAFCLNKSSYQRLLNGIPLSSLPPTFQDASFIARRLGVRYIWIDALCIFQDKDDLSDWNREASLMHRVYSNTLCNIVAAENTNSSQSIFRSRNPEHLIPPTTAITLQTPYHHLQSHDDLQTPYRYTFNHPGYWRAVEQAHINTRGWVLQERFMSPRTLHFGTHQVFWECREKRAAEVNPDGLYIEGSRKSPFKGRITGKWAWEGLIEKYSTCDLSYASDKLIAISAIAKKAAVEVPDRYVAGMWHHSLRGDLLWSVSSEGDPVGSRYETYTAPSWSWASINGRIYASECREEPARYLFRVDDYKLEYATDDETGAIRAGWLRLSGRLKRLRLLRSATSGLRCRQWSLVIDGFLSEGKSANPWVVRLDSPQEDFCMENKNGTLYCMPARHTGPRIFDGRSDIYLLMLHLTDSTKGTFRRIGLAVALTDDIDVGSLLNADGVDCEDSPSPAPKGASCETTLPCAAYEGGIHSIYVI